MMGKASASCLAMIGSLISSGSKPRTRETRSRTSCAQRSMSRARSNSMVMLLTCSRLWLVRVLMPSMLLISSSSRSLTSVSTTAALAPGYTVVTLTIGGSMSGNSRTGRRDRPMTPKRMSARLIIVARMGRWMLILGRTISGRFQIRRRRLRRRKCHFRSRPDLLHARDDNFFPGLQAAYNFYLAGEAQPELDGPELDGVAHVHGEDDGPVAVQ